MIRAVILGGTGYGGMELLRYLLGHSGVDIVALTSRTDESPVANRYPHLLGLTDLAFTKESESVLEELAGACDVVFSAKPHGVGSRELPALLTAAPDVRVVDLSGDFRLRDAALYPQWYDYEHPYPAWLTKAAYGLAECGLREQIARARLVANPGCHASATVLALWPCVQAGLVKGRISVASVTGSSGSGSRPKATTHHPERFSNFKAYRPLRHQHLPEVEQALGGKTRIDFVPHSAPVARGIHVTAFVPVGDADQEQVFSAFAERWRDEPFIRLRKGTVDLRASQGTNFVDIGISVMDGMAVIALAQDNLGKGMAGSAVQNMNIMFGLPETTGLDRGGPGL